jgi:trk system potassium uptake protein TrkA
MRIIIVGAGFVGSTLADRLSGDGHDVAIIDNDLHKVRGLAETHDVQVIQANGATAEALRRAGIEKADLVVATSDVDEVNLVVGLLSALLFEIPRIIVRLRDARHQEAFSLAHGDHERCPERWTWSRSWTTSSWWRAFGSSRRRISSACGSPT